MVKVYSPDATWPAVKRALTGASIVVYLGHGNGWPSRYRDHLYPPTQNGFGLNPRAGGDDHTHQYFGEASVEDIRLAPNAVVVFSHLCYASGNTEPGLPEGTRAQAVQRVDNYAAGFLRAGAKAVVAEAGLGPAYYVRSILRDRRSIETIWKSSPTANGRHSIVARSQRTPGYVLRLDPDRADSGFRRSLVTRGVTASEVRSGAMGAVGNGGRTAEPVQEPTLASAGFRFAEPLLRGMPIAGTTSRVVIPLVNGRSTQVPAGAQVSVRWDPLQLDAPPAPEPTLAPAPSPSPTPTPEAAVTAPASPTVDPDIVARFERPHATPVPPQPTAVPAPTPTPTPPPVAPEVDLVVPEQLGSVVEPIRAKRGARGLALDIAYPTAPGLYRLTATLHTPEGVAYDEATQALLTPVLVRVGGAMAVAYGAPSTLAVPAGSTTEVAVRVLNAGASRWDAEVPAPPDRVSPEPDPEATPGRAPAPDATPRTKTVFPSLVATWVSADGLPVPDALSVRLGDGVSAPGGTADVLLGLGAPSTPGTYLLLLDVVTPTNGPMTALGNEPAIIRVTVNEVATPTPAPSAIAPAPSVPDPSPEPVVTESPAWSED